MASSYGTYDRGPNDFGDQYKGNFSFTFFVSHLSRRASCVNVFFPDAPRTSHVVLLPAGGQDALELHLILRVTTTSNRRVPGETRLLTERSHRLDQLIHLCAQ